MSRSRFVVLGLGRVGKTLARVLAGKGEVLALSYSRQLKKRLAAAPRDALVFVCWPDRITDQRKALLTGRRLVSVSAMRSDAAMATFHPLFGFPPGGLLSLDDVPIGISGSRAVSRAVLNKLAKSLGAKPFAIPNNRTLYHAAAVAGGAGVITVWQMALDMLVAAGVPQTKVGAILGPIAGQALGNARRVGVRAALTGPVVRGEQSVIAAHLRAVAESEIALGSLYDRLIGAMHQVAASASKATEARRTSDRRKR